MLRRLLVSSSLLLCFSVIVHTQIDSCRYYAGCSTQDFATACYLTLDKVTCSDGSWAQRIDASMKAVNAKPTVPAVVAILGSIMEKLEL